MLECSSQVLVQFLGQREQLEEFRLGGCTRAFVSIVLLEMVMLQAVRTGGKLLASAVYVSMKALSKQASAFCLYAAVADKLIVGPHSSYIADDPLILHP